MSIIEIRTTTNVIEMRQKTKTSKIEKKMWIPNSR
jgi:hypothetical protein